LAAFDPKRHGGELMADVAVGREKLALERDSNAPQPPVRDSDK